jgi:hypothetical protein
MPTPAPSSAGLAAVASKPAESKRGAFTWKVWRASARVPADIAMEWPRHGRLSYFFRESGGAPWHLSAGGVSIRSVKQSGAIKAGIQESPHGR